MSNICLFEDEGYRNFLPLTWTRPVWELRTGITTLYEKIVSRYPRATVDLICRMMLADAVKEVCPKQLVNRISTDQVLFLNGRLLADADLNIPAEGENEIFFNKSDLVGFRLNGTALEKIKPALGKPISRNLIEAVVKGIAATEIKTTLVRYPWDLIQKNAEQIQQDFTLLAKQKKANGKIYEGAHLVNPNAIYIGKDTQVLPGAVLNAEEGPIYIGDDVKIFPNSTVIGPAFVGNGSQIKVGAKIYGGTSIGSVCKIGGEVEGTIIQSYSNKQHDGFLGHSYVGSWVNLGAGTSNSDLKNNYRPVKVYLNGQEVNTGSIFMGLIIADHAKSGINTMFNTGTVVGVASNIFGAGFPPKYIPSFSWGGAEGLTEYELEKALDVARRVMSRRNVTLTAAAEGLLREVFRQTVPERAGFVGE